LCVFVCGGGFDLRLNDLCCSAEIDWKQRGDFENVLALKHD